MRDCSWVSHAEPPAGCRRKRCSAALFTQRRCSPEVLKVVLQDVGHVLSFALGALAVGVHGIQAAVRLQQQADHLHHPARMARSASSSI
jgi:hypothetical protein